MDIKKLKEELEELEGRRFSLDMKDRWEHDDFQKDKELLERRKEIEKELLKYGIKVYSEYSHDINYIELTKEGDEE